MAQPRAASQQPVDAAAGIAVDALGAIEDEVGGGLGDVHGYSRSATRGRALTYQTNASITLATSSPGTGPTRTCHEPSSVCASRARMPASASSRATTVARRCP